MISRFKNVFSNIRACPVTGKYSNYKRWLPLSRSYVHSSSTECPVSASVFRKQVDTMFDSTDTEKILNIINYGTVEELSSGSLSPAKIRQILDRRKMKQFVKLSELMELKGFGEKRVLYVGQGILLSLQKSTPRKYYNYVVEKLKPVYMSNIKPSKVLAVSATMHGFSWMLMDKDYVVHDWEHHNLQDLFKFRHDHNVVLKKLWNLTKGFPRTDVYLMEEYWPLVRNLKAVQSSLVQTYLDTVVTMLLNQNGPDQQNPVHAPETVYKFSSTQLSNHFKLNIGGERVSSLNLIDNIYHKRTDKFQADISGELMFYYLKKKPFEQEIMGSCFLQCVMFYDLLAKNAGANYKEAVVNSEKKRKTVVNIEEERKPVVNIEEERKPVVNIEEEREEVVNIEEEREEVINIEEEREGVVNSEEELEIQLSAK